VRAGSAPKLSLIGPWSKKSQQAFGFLSLIFYQVTVLVFSPAVQATQHCFGLRSKGFLGHHQKCFFWSLVAAVHEQLLLLN
jgi:hypothetical protein